MFYQTIFSAYFKNIFNSILKYTLKCMFDLSILVMTPFKFL